MTLAAVLTSWLVTGVPVAVFLGRMIAGADRLSLERELRPRSEPARVRAA